MPVERDLAEFRYGSLAAILPIYFGLISRVLTAWHNDRKSCSSPASTIIALTLFITFLGLPEIGLSTHAFLAFSHYESNCKLFNLLSVLIVFEWSICVPSGIIPRKHSYTNRCQANIFYIFHENSCKKHYNHEHHNTSKAS